VDTPKVQISQDNLIIVAKLAETTVYHSYLKLVVNGLQKYVQLIKNVLMEYVDNFYKNNNLKTIDVATRTKIAN